MLERYQMWLAWMLAVGLSVSGSVYITFQSQMKTITPVSYHLQAGGGEETAQAAVSTPLAESAPAPSLYGPPGKLSDGVPLLMYHSITEMENNKLCVSPRDFEQQLDFLVREGYQTITVKHLMAAADGKAVLPTKPLIITLDDGYRDNYTVAYPLLRNRGMVATIYVIAEKIGTPNGITAAELREMASYGIEIGSHTRHHLDLRTLNEMELVDEIANSKEILTQTLQEPIETFSYPSGKYSSQVIHQVKEAGYSGAVTTHPGVMSDRQDRWLMPRIRVNGGESLEQFIASLPNNI